MLGLNLINLGNDIEISENGNSFYSFYISIYCTQCTVEDIAFVIVIPVYLTYLSMEINQLD